MQSFLKSLALASVVSVTTAQNCNGCAFLDDGASGAVADATPAGWGATMCQTGFCVNCGACGVGRIRMDSRGTCDLDYCACTGDSQCNEACPNFDASQPVTSERTWGRLSEPLCQDSRTCESTQDLCSNGCCGGPFGGCPDGCTGSSVQTINGQRSCTCTGCPTGPQVDVHDVPNLDVLTASNPIFCASDYSQVLLDLGWCTSCDTCTSLQGDIDDMYSNCEGAENWEDFKPVFKQFAEQKGCNGAAQAMPAVAVVVIAAMQHLLA